MAWQMKKITIGKPQHIQYVEFLLAEKNYNIMISRHYLFRILRPFWIVLLLLFSIQNKFFFGYVVLPNILLYFILLFSIYEIWKCLNIPLKAYIAFHTTVLVILKLLSIPVGYLLEVLWTLCF